MAEGFLRALGGDSFDVVSAGSEETALDPEAVVVMREVGVDISGQETKSVNRFLGRRFSYVVTLCDREKEKTCPILGRARFGGSDGISKTLRNSGRGKSAVKPCAAYATTFSTV